MDEQWRDNNLQILWYLQHAQKNVTIHQFAQFSEAEKAIARKLAALQLQQRYRQPPLSEKIPTERNFRIVVSDREMGGLEIGFVRDGETFPLNPLLADGYTFNHRNGTPYCDFTEKVVEVQTNDDSAALPYDILHEIDHTHYTFLRNDPHFISLCSETVFACRFGSKSESDALSSQILDVLSNFQPLSQLARYQRFHMRELFMRREDCDTYALANEGVQATLERMAWAYADDMVETLSCQGWNFGISQHERAAHRLWCLASYAVPRFLVALYRGKIDGLLRYQSPFFAPEDMPEALRDILEEAKALSPGNSA